LKSDKKPAPNRCNVCGEIFVVDSLARICELKHSGIVYKTAAEELLEKKIKEEEDL
jgi:hypothetical protein